MTQAGITRPMKNAINLASALIKDASSLKKNVKKQDKRMKNATMMPTQDVIT